MSPSAMQEGRLAVLCYLNKGRVSGSTGPLAVGSCRHCRTSLMRMPTTAPTIRCSSALGFRVVAERVAVLAGCGVESVGGGRL